MYLASGGAADNIAPTVAITCTQTGPTATTPLNFTATFSETVTGFTSGDVTAAISGGTVTLSNFAGSGAVYTFDLAPSVAGTMTVDIGAGVCVDGAGNGNVAATQFSIVTILMLFNDTFTTDDAAPIATPRTAEPGPGTATITDANSIMSLAGGKLVVNGTGVNNEGYSGPQTTRAAGLCAAITLAAVTTGNTNVIAGWGNTAAGNARATTNIVAAGNNIISAASDGFTSGNLIVTLSFPHVRYSILQTTGALEVIGDKFIWADLTGTGNWYPGVGVRANALNFTVDAMKVAILPSPWNSLTGIATGNNQTPASGDSITHDANGYIYFKWTCATNEVLIINLRYTSDNDRWYIQCDQANSTMKIFEVVSGTATERASQARTWTNATVYQIWIFNNVLAANHIGVQARPINPANAAGTVLTYSSASSGALLTTAKVTGFTTGAFFVSYPYTIPAAALAVLQGF